MSRLKASDARQDFSEIINRVAYRGERIVLHRRGKDIAAIVSLEDLELLEQLEDRVDLKQAKAALKEVEKKGTKSLSSVIKELGTER